MAKRRKVDVTFRQTPVHGIKGTINSMFKEQFNSFNISPILEHLVKKIEDTRYGKLKRNLFTLVNVYNPDTQHSVGYLDAPPSQVITPLSGLVFTFALTSRPLSRVPKDIEKNRVVDQTIFWGKDTANLLDYLTINIPKDFLAKSKCQYPYIDDLLYLYNVSGLYTKNYVLNSLDIYDNSPVEVLRTRYFDANLKYLFNSCSRQYWKYCDEFWNKCPNLVISSDFDDHFYLYYSLYLYDRVSTNCAALPKYKLFTRGEGTLHWFLMDGLRAFVQSVKSSGSVVVEPSLVAATSLMLYLLEGEGLASETSKREVDAFITGIRNRIKNDSNSYFEFSNAFSDLDKVAMALVDLNKDAAFLRFWS